MMPVIGPELYVPFTVGGEQSIIEAEYKNEEKAVLGSVANIKYYHQAKEWNSPLSFGVQAFIEYNGLILNDRHQADLIRVTKVTGLDDAEVRDNREFRASESGEFPYEAFYAGRNIVISGFIEAGNLGALGTLETNLKAAFASLEESQLKFRWFDIYDSFDDPNSILEYRANASLSSIPSGNYTPLIGSLSSIKAENGLLSWKNTGEIKFLRTSEKRTFGDVQMTLKCVVGSLDSSYIGFILCAKNSENYLEAHYSGHTGFPILKIASFNEGIENILFDEEMPINFDPVVGQAFWIRGRKEGNIISFEYWNELPVNSSLPNFAISTILTGEDEENYGNEVLSQVGISGNQLSTLWGFDNFMVESLYPGDVEFQARKISPLSIPSEQTSLSKFKRPFQIAMKTSDFRAFSATQITNIMYPSSSEVVPERGFSLPLRLPLKFNILSSKELPLDTNLISVNNRGTTYVEPIIFIYGPGENILIENLTNEQSMEWLGVINKNDYIEIECGKEKTIKNSIGLNYLEPLTPTVEWIRLEPKWNDIYITGSGFVNEITKVAIKLRYGWM